MEQLLRKTRKELVKMCKEKKLKCSGSKHTLAQYLIGTLNGVKQTRSGKSKPVAVTKAAPVFSHLTRPIIPAIQHPSGHVLINTDLIYCANNGGVIGAYRGNKVCPLRKSDIEWCRFTCVHYAEPFNLSVE